METAAKNFNRLKNNLEDLGLKQMAQHLEEFIETVSQPNGNIIDSLLTLSNLELKAKEERAVLSCVKTANFPFIKTFKDFDFSYQPSINKEALTALTDLRFIENYENIIFIGSPGVGKTHLSVALGIECARNRKSVYFIHCQDLLSQLKKASHENRIDERLKYLTRHKVLIIDEVGFIPFDYESGKLFFQLISKRYENKPTIITTNKPLSQWGEIFGDPVMANAILDRLLHHSKIFKIVGQSYRTKDLMEELENQDIERMDI